MSDELVRTYEQIIDTGFQSLPIFTLPVEDAAYGVLHAFDSHIMTEWAVRQHSEDGSFSLAQAQLFKFLGEGLILAMRWLLGDRDRVDVRPTASIRQAELGNELIQYGADYFRASMLYSAYSQGRMDAVVQPDERRVRFSYKPEAVHPQGTWGYAEEASREMLKNTPARRKQIQRLQSEAAAVFRSVPHRLQDGRVVLEDVSPLLDERVRRAVGPGLIRRRILPPTSDLGGFLAGQFDAFWQALFTWSVCATEIYHYSCEHLSVPQEEAMPTQVVSRDDFVRSMAALSGLSFPTVEAILCRLTFDRRTGKPDMYLQPFVCGPSQVAWSVRAVQLSVAQRNLLKLMARTPSHKALADNLVGGRERNIVDALAKRLDGKGWTIARFRCFPGQEDGEVDLVGWNWTYPTEVLVVEVKSTLQADEPNEVRSATREMKHAQDQLDRTLRVVSALPETIRKKWLPSIDWSKVVRWYGVVVTPESEPGLDFDHSRFPACSLASLQARLTDNDWRSPSKVWGAMVSRSWQADIRAGRTEFEPFDLAGITFEDPIIVY
ncbi:MAG TPA: hypothetical protein VHR66_01805 [Gemmataceae bacterium]|nr:hypothetical protein [Gemmataceae bacterium]